MALLVAPYNPAMRLGMGFNSFTQQLCVNDAVKTPDGNASSPELFTAQRPKYKEGLMSADDGSETVSQSVTWTAKFVDRISEVTDSMNISGSLQIKCDAIGGGGGASASFLDSNKFKESDINYFIQVKVTNQQLVAPNLSEFCPIQGVRPADFTRVYGDSFISGFIEGGEFNALVSIKLKDRSTAKDISGQLKVQLDLKGASVEGEAKAGVKKENKSFEGETTISVSWTGGGDIKNGDVKDWTLDTLKAVALEFPEHVMACPMRTSAILTKYSGLNSFQRHVNQMGSPLDYENAGVYSSALLDAYMDYKVMWRNISQAAWEVEQGQSMLERKPDIADLADLAREAKGYYENELAAYNKKVNLITAQDAANGSALEPVEGPDGSTEVVAPAPSPVATLSKQVQDIDPPFPPNELVPYRADIFGLDKARKDCRFEMIKIVREVDAVANNPKVATDPFRSWQYLSPAVFRMLLPTVRNLDKEKAEAKAREEARIASETHAKEIETKLNELTDTKRRLAEAEGKAKEGEEAVKSLRPFADWYPGTLNAPIRIKSAHTQRGFDYNSSCEVFHQWDHIPNNEYQKYTIVRASSTGFLIQNPSTGRYLTANPAIASPDERVYMSFTKFGTVFSFESRPDGTFFIHLADRPQYILLPEHLDPALGVKYCVWPHPEDRARFYIENF